MLADKLVTPACTQAPLSNVVSVDEITPSAIELFVLSVEDEMETCAILQATHDERSNSSSASPMPQRMHAIGSFVVLVEGGMVHCGLVLSTLSMTGVMVGVRRWSLSYYCD